MTTTLAPPGCGICSPCQYENFERHRDACAICLPAPTAHDYCSVGLALLDLALGEAGLPLPAPQPPTNAMTRDLGEIALSALADELRLYTVIYQHSPTSADEVRPWGGDGCEVRDRADQALRCDESPGPPWRGQRLESAMTGLALPLVVRSTPGIRNDRRSYDIVDAHGRLIATLASDHFESARYRMFDAEAVANMWADAANATAPVPAEVVA